jgi:hypothetical protein
MRQPGFIGLASAFLGIGANPRVHGPTVGKGGPKSDPDAIADTCWDLYQHRS